MKLHFVFSGIFAIFKQIQINKLLFCEAYKLNIVKDTRLLKTAWALRMKETICKPELGPENWELLQRKLQEDKKARTSNNNDT